MDGWMQGRQPHWQADLDCQKREWGRRTREREEIEKVIDRSGFHLCSVVPLCEGSFAVVISADVLCPVTRLQLSAAGKAAAPHQPRCLTQSCSITWMSASAVNLMRTCGALWMHLPTTRSLQCNSMDFFPNKKTLLLYMIMRLIYVKYITSRFKIWVNGQSSHFMLNLKKKLILLTQLNVILKFCFVFYQVELKKYLIELLFRFRQ